MHCPAWTYDDIGYDHPPAPDEVLSELATLQHGAVASWQLRGMGMSASMIQHRLARGRLHRLYRGVYAVGHTALSRRGELMAAVLVSGNTAVIGGLAAAEIWGMSRFPRRLIDVVVERRHRPVPGLRYHHTRSLPDDEIGFRDNIPLTSIPRTLVDMADHMSRFQIAWAIKQVDHHGLLNWEELEEVSYRHRTRPGRYTLLRAIELIDEGSSGTRSELEEGFVNAIHERAENPWVNRRVPVEDGAIEIDLFWPDVKLVVEIDGRGHLSESMKHIDARRDTRLRKAGCEIVRIPAAVIEADRNRAADQVIGYLSRLREQAQCTTDAP
jgi:very-short-patch-repair endonuclease/predicted transcriptional regulator of viral defense system